MSVVCARSEIEEAAGIMMMSILKGWAAHSGRDHHYRLDDMLRSIWGATIGRDNSMLYGYNTNDWSHRTRELLVARICTLMLKSYYVNWEGELSRTTNVTLFMDLVRND